MGLGGNVALLVAAVVLVLSLWLPLETFWKPSAPAHATPEDVNSGGGVEPTLSGEGDAAIDKKVKEQPAEKQDQAEREQQQQQPERAQQARHQKKNKQEPRQQARAQDPNPIEQRELEIQEGMLEAEFKYFEEMERQEEASRKAQASGEDSQPGESSFAGESAAANPALVLANLRAIRDVVKPRSEEARIALGYNVCLDAVVDVFELFGAAGVNSPR